MRVLIDIGHPAHVHLFRNMALELMKEGSVVLFTCREKEFEKELLEEWAKKYTNTFSVAGKYSILNELKIISNLDVLISMDSANMHLASLVNTPVVSIWGATHRFAGCYGWKQNADNTVEVELSCRPCSVYGNKPCFRKDYACLNRITPEMIISKVNSVVDRYGRI